MRGHASQVVAAYQETFKDNAAARALVWILGAQLKLFLGFWPHLIVQAGKASGKSTLIKRLERTTGMKMFSGQSMTTHTAGKCKVMVGTLLCRLSEKTIFSLVYPGLAT